MSIRTKVLGLVDVMMRVPPILVIDEILKISMGLPTRFYPATIDNGFNGGLHNTTSELISAALKNTSILANATLDEAIDNISTRATQDGVLSGSFNVLMDEFAHDTNILNMLSLTSIRFVICLIGFLCAASIFMLWTRHLVMVYMFIISLGLTVFSYWLNVSALDVMEKMPCMLKDLISLNTTRLLDTGGIAMTLLPHLVAQWFMGTLFAYIHLGPRYTLLQKYMPLIFASPILCALLPLPSHLIGFFPALAGSVPMLLSKITLLNSAMEAGKTVYNGYQYSMNFVSNFGLSSLIENEWQRLNVPSVLRVFWTIRITQEFVTMMMSDSISNMSLLPTIQKLLVDGCETLTAVLGMTSVISIICHYIGKAFQWYLLTFDSDEEKSLGTVAAVLFYVLALQTGLTSLSPDKRFVRLCRNVYLLVTALLHFLHNIVSPILMSLSAARNPSRKRHIRALSVCFFLVAVSSCLLISLWSRQTPSTWLLAVTAFSIEVIIKVLVSLATYTLFLLDARRQTFWEKLDDYLYYVRAFGNSVEFCFGILLFFNGAWILLFESGGAIRAIMMCIHAYFNIWCEARAGWSVFMKRRSAVHKISTLPEATAEQLRAFDDVCAICYQEMYSAKITRCRHFFHGVCLRKWLYVQDRCPLCHEIMMYTDKDEVRDRSQTVTATSPQRQIHSRDDDAPHQMAEHLTASAAVSISTQTPSRHAEAAAASSTSITASLFSTSSSISSTITSGSSFAAYPTATSTALSTAAANNITTTGAISAATDAADQD